MRRSHLAISLLAELTKALPLGYLDRFPSSLSLGSRQLPLLVRLVGEASLTIALLQWLPFGFYTFWRIPR
jgi:hypothetical protein